MPDKTFYRVDIFESERGWGSRIDESIYFTKKGEAEQYVKDYNDKYNTASSTPDWYMSAQSPISTILTEEEVKRIQASKSERKRFAAKK